ncbi:acetyl-CoA synthetase-like protein [Trametes coccinea BRFM310]|uniref:Acetyl-CoA synthetase-like protein n=1 Tax=Trametes coccinea (strain BRFM310) TaxID=1353009 RepID=A0A1Y2J4N2_TRAC3|nr:acetyl-CoA synthetase-like protein [Trametes coccinea BRFM310]
MHYKSLFPPLPPVPDTNAHDFIFNSPALQEPEDKVLLIDPFGGKTWKKNEFKERVYDCATAFLTPESQGGFGFAPEGEMVAIMSPNCLEYVTLVHSLFRVAIPFALIPASSTAFELQHLFRTSEATRFFVHPTLLPQALEVAQVMGLPHDRVYVMEGRVEGRRDVGSVIRAVRERKVSRVASKPVTRTTLAYLVFSSGTSGLPKAVMISHRNVVISLVQAALAAEYEGPNPMLETIPPVSLGFLPFYHTYGLHYVVIRPVAQVIPTIVLPRWNVDAVLDLIPKYRVSILSLTPPAMLQLVNHPRIRQVDLSSLVLTGSGAAHLPPKLAQAFKQLLKNVESVGEGYGMSEMTISGTRTAHPKFGGPKPGSAGVLLPGMEAKIVREDGTLAGPNEPGELWLLGENIALGYWRNEKATKETFVDGWLHTGDKFRIDEDQHFFFVERAKDILKVSGAQVSPTEIEEAILAHPDKLIVDVTVAGVSGGRTSDEKVPRAWIVLSEEGKRRGEKEVVQELHTWVQKNLSKYKWLRGGIEIVDEIPKNPTGKVLRRVLQDRFEQQVQAQKAATRAKL